MRCMDQIGQTQGSKTHVHKSFLSNNTLTETTVRHPVNWLRSYYTAIYPGKVGIEAIDALSFQDVETFDQFVGRYLEECPGQVGRVFGCYASDGAIRLEDSPWGLIEFLDAFRKLRGFEIDAIRGVGIRNSSKKLPNVAGHIHRAIVLAEQDFCDRYEYF